MKITFVTETYPPEINGVALTVLSLVQHCRKLGHHVEVVRPEQPGDVLKTPERLIVELLLPGAQLPLYAGLRFGLPAKRRLLKHWQNVRPQGVYVATEGPLGWTAVSAARQLGIPVVTGLHTRFDDFMNHYGLSFLRRPAFAFMRAFHNRARATLVPTKSLQKLLHSRGFKRVERLERAVDTSAFAPEHRSETVRAAWGCKPFPCDSAANKHASAPVVLFVGRIAAEKNLPLAVRAFNAIAQRYPDARMIWVGDGPASGALRASLVADTRHFFCGMLRGEALAAAYASADLFLFPSMSETFGNVTLEALASGLPVCAFNYGAAEEFVVNGGNGQLAHFGDEASFVAQALWLAHAMHDDPLSLRQCARRSVEHLNPSNVAGALVELFQELRPVNTGSINRFAQAQVAQVQVAQPQGAHDAAEYERV